MEGYNIIKPEELNDNIFKLIGLDWMLITAGNKNAFNTMTASWGSMGVLWHKQVCFIFVRPQRYTYEFIEKNEFFTLSFFTEKYRKALNLCGSKSGRDIDKVAETGLTPEVSKNGSIYFSEARLIVECKKLYFQDIKPENFIDPQIEKNYKSNDYHRMYIGEIISCIMK